MTAPSHFCLTFSSATLTLQNPCVFPYALYGMVWNKTDQYLQQVVAQDTQRRAWSRGFLIFPTFLYTLAHEHPHENVMSLLEQRHLLLGLWRREFMHGKEDQARREFLQIHDLMALFSACCEYVDLRQCYHFLFHAKVSPGKIIWWQDFRESLFTLAPSP